MTVEPTAPPVVTICKQKLQGGRGWWQGHLVREDDDGIWLYTPAGSTFRSRSDGVEHECEVEGGGGPGLDSLVLVPRQESWFLACWKVPERRANVTVDICGWLRRDRDAIVFEDWELDLVRFRDGSVAVVDLDDFVEARTAELITGQIGEQALAAAAWVERALKHRTPPFDDRGDELLARCSGLGLPSLTGVPGFS